ncbi:unnamed protein product [Rhizophagus irregularis]|nr:unnamed protein product [Rhizophagus irregularis]
MFGINTTKNFIGINTKFETKNVRIFSNDKFICLKIEDEIIVYSIELRISIATLDINNDIQLYNFMKHTGLCLVLLQLFDRIPNKGIWKSIMDYCWKESLDRLNIENPLPNNIRTINNYGIKEDFEHLNAHLFSPYMNAIRKLFDVASSNYVQKRELEFNQWKIKIDDDEIELQVLKDKWYRTSTKFDCDYSNFEK